MDSIYLSPEKRGTAEITEKRSRFIGNIVHVDSEEEAVEFVKQIKKEYYDAKHSAYAYITGGIKRYSDDGEPAKTAGLPILDMLDAQKITDCVCVVTRYFGGVLLGTGGLVRAYTKAVQEGLDNSQVAMLAYGTSMKIETDYNGIGKLQYILGKAGVAIQSSEYTDVVTLQVFLLQEQKEVILKEMTEATAGKCKFEELEEKYELLL